MAWSSSDSGAGVALPAPHCGMAFPAEIMAIFAISLRQDARGRMSGSGNLWQAVHLIRASFSAAAGFGAAGAERTGLGARLPQARTTAMPAAARRRTDRRGESMAASYA